MYAARLADEPAIDPLRPPESELDDRLARCRPAHPRRFGRNERLEVDNV